MENKKILIIIQARMNSKRLPGKVLKKIMGRSVLEHIILRLGFFKSNLVVSTSENLKDKKIVDFCKDQKIKYFVGSELDVLDRFYKTALYFKAKNIIRITADCPLVDYRLIKKLINFFFKSNYDHAGIATGAGVSNLKCNKFPDGMDAECFKFSALKIAWEKAKKKLDREHVTPYIWKNKKKFKVGILIPKKNYSYYRLTIDNDEDLKFIRIIFRKLYKWNNFFSMESVVDLLRQNPLVVKLNKKYIGKENYKKIFN